MEFLLFALKWAGIAIAAILALFPTFFLLWKLVRGLAFLGLAPIMVPWHGVFTIKYRRGFAPFNYVHSADELERIGQLENALETSKFQQSELDPAFEATRRKADGSIDRRGRGGAIEDTMASLKEHISSLSSNLETAKSAPLNRARSRTTPYAALIGYLVAVVVGLALLPVMVTALFYARPFWPAAYEFIVGLHPIIKLTAICAIAGAVGQLTMQRVRDSRAFRIMDESAIVAESYGPDALWVRGYSGALADRVQTAEG